LNEALVDLQLKQLTKLCLANKNYKKLAGVIMSLVSNRLDEIGIRLGIKPREKDTGESMGSFMESINSIIQSNFDIELFPYELLGKVRYNEAVLTRRNITLDLGHIETIRALIHCYYELRKLDIPDVYQSLSNQDVLQVPQVKLLSFMSGERSKSKRQMEGITPLILQKIRQQERDAERQLKQRYDPDLFEKILQLKAIRKSFQKKKSRTITIEGSIRDNINYLRSKERLIQYLLIGWIILLGMLGVVILTQTLLFPITTMGISPYLLIIFGPCVLLILLYRYYLKSGGGL